LRRKVKRDEGKFKRPIQKGISKGKDCYIEGLKEEELEVHHLAGNGLGRQEEEEET